MNKHTRDVQIQVLKTLEMWNTNKIMWGRVEDQIYLTQDGITIQIVPVDDWFLDLGKTHKENTHIEKFMKISNDLRLARVESVINEFDPKRTVAKLVTEDGRFAYVNYDLCVLRFGHINRLEFFVEDVLKMVIVRDANNAEVIGGILPIRRK